MEITKGYYKQNVYEHTYGNEFVLFKEAISDLITERIVEEDKTLEIDIYGIEIGVLNGDTSAFLLGINKNIHLTGIDPLIPDSMEHSLVGSINAIEKNTAPFANRFNFVHDYSQNIHAAFLNEQYDFIFIDGDHTYEAAKQDYELYYSKIRKGGLIFFHDSRMYRGGAPFHEGSSKFVSDLIAKETKIKLIAEAFSLTCFKKL